MQIWLKNLMLPVVPGEYKISTSQGDQTVTTVGLGEILLKGKRGLKGIAFSSFFPARYDPSYCAVRSPESPMQYVKQIEKMKDSGTVKLVITGTSVNMVTRIQSFDWSEQDGTGDVYFDISLKEYRSVSAGATSVVTLDSIPAESTTGTTVSTDATRSETKPADANSGKTYVVKKGDTLSGIARKLTGSADWQALYRLNRATIGDNPDYIQIGMVLTIP